MKSGKSNISRNLMIWQMQRLLGGASAQSRWHATIERKPRFQTICIIWNAFETRSSFISLKMTKIHIILDRIFFQIPCSSKQPTYVGYFYQTNTSAHPFDSNWIGRRSHLCCNKSLVVAGAGNRELKTVACSKVPSDVIQRHRTEEVRTVHSTNRGGYILTKVSFVRVYPKIPLLWSNIKFQV